MKTKPPYLRDLSARAACKKLMKLFPDQFVSVTEEVNKYTFSPSFTDAPMTKVVYAANIGHSKPKKTYREAIANLLALAESREKHKRSQLVKPVTETQDILTD